MATLPPVASLDTISAAWANSVITQVNSMPRGQLAYGQAVAAQNNIGTTQTDITGLTLTATVPTGRRLRLSWNIQINVANANIAVFLWVLGGATTLMAQGWQIGLVGWSNPVGSVLFNSNGVATTYKVQMNTTSGTFNTAPGATSPAFLMLEDVGLSS